MIKKAFIIFYSGKSMIKKKLSLYFNSKLYHKYDYYLSNIG